MNTKSGEVIYIRPILRLKNPETWKGEFPIHVETITEEKVIDMEGNEYLLQDYKVMRG